MRQDKDLQADVMRELEWEPSVESAGIGVAAHKGSVTLAGHVGSYAEKVAAVKAARRVYGVRAVADELTVEQTARRFIVSTEPEEHVQQIKRYLDLGFTHLVFHSPGPDQERFLRLYGEEILPRLRAL